MTSWVREIPVVIKEFECPLFANTDVSVYQSMTPLQAIECLESIAAEMNGVLKQLNRWDKKNHNGSVVATVFRRLRGDKFIGLGEDAFEYAENWACEIERATSELKELLEAMPRDVVGKISKEII